MVAPRSLEGFLKSHPLVFLDTSAFISFIEHHPRYSHFCETLFSRIESGKTRRENSYSETDIIAKEKQHAN